MVGVFQPGHGRAHQFSVLAKQDGIDDRLMIEKPHGSRPQIGPPVVTGKIDRDSIKEMPIKIERGKFHFNPWNYVSRHKGYDKMWAI